LVTELVVIILINTSNLKESINLLVINSINSMKKVNNYENEPNSAI